MIDMYKFDDEKTVLLDFACGSGLLSHELAPSCKRIIGMDISAGMVSLYNKSAENQGLTEDEMHAYSVDILIDELPFTLPNDGFDAISVSKLNKSWKSFSLKFV
jgi:2-polyprenyl-3-methyl-5-hydroxy-6-metoxy-1,4-benzoquinol methylase